LISNAQEHGDERAPGLQEGPVVLQGKNDQGKDAKEYIWQHQLQSLFPEEGHGRIPERTDREKARGKEKHRNMVCKDEGIYLASFITKVADINCPDTKELKNIDPRYSVIVGVHDFSLKGWMCFGEF